MLISTITMSGQFSLIFQVRPGRHSLARPHTASLCQFTILNIRPLRMISSSLQSGLYTLYFLHICRKGDRYLGAIAGAAFSMVMPDSGKSRRTAPGGGYKDPVIPCIRPPVPALHSVPQFLHGYRALSSTHSSAGPFPSMHDVDCNGTDIP